jgi:hypothetical protein
MDRISGFADVGERLRLDHPWSSRGWLPLTPPVAQTYAYIRDEKSDRAQFLSLSHRSS